jgi:glycosyltransferase involved in cell wall biosynthesis
VRRLLRAADLFVLPSLYEGGSSQALLEAMEEGVPCVASDLPGVAEVAEDGIHALLVPPGDVDALAVALLRLASDDAQRRRVAEAARLRAGAYGAEAMFRATATRLAELMMRNKRPAIHGKYEKFWRLIFGIRQTGHTER